MLQFENGLDKVLTVAGVAASLGLSPRQLERRFRADVGLSPREFRMRPRLSRAAWLLEHADLSVTEVGLDCGFGDASHFSRLFTLRQGRRPPDLRRKGIVGPTSAPALAPRASPDGCAEVGS